MSQPSALAILRSPRTIRERAAQLLAAGTAGQLAHFRVDMARLPEVARLTAEITRQRYPDLRVPAHSRFTHFDAAGVQRTAALERDLSGLPALERARRLTELVVVSVLLDAGAGSAWGYVEPSTGIRLGRSEGLAVASLDWAASGGLSAQRHAYRVDAAGLHAVAAQALATAFQVTSDNPLVGLPGRVHLLRALGTALSERPDVFGEERRIGGLVDRLCERSHAGTIAASDVLALLLDALGSIWPGRLTLEGVPLGDVWVHAAISGEGATQQLLPLHKLSQWLCYSLIQPLAVAGLTMSGLDALTGLAEYRNGGLFLDGGVLAPTRAAALSETHAVGSELVVEWRGLTVALLDRIAPLVRSELSLSESELPLAAVLEGGTWAAGRALAQRLREDGGPPLRIVSDGTVF
ncbi:MAG: hypothetical protein RL701_6790 [Pseudomonadota bacterium]